MTTDHRIDHELVAAVWKNDGANAAIAMESILSRIAENKKEVSEGRYSCGCCDDAEEAIIYLLKTIKETQ